jgi:aldehyde dehydrogenase (NAD+)
LFAATGVPFGGYKDSGIGREKSEYALRAYTQVSGHKYVKLSLGPWCLLHEGAS